MKNSHNTNKRQGFTLMETMIALAVMTVLITGFLGVFGPAAGSIRKALTIDEINRMQATLERELGTLRSGVGSSDAAYPTSFGKAMDWIANSHATETAVILYKYRGDTSKTPRDDGTLEPYKINEQNGDFGKSGEDYVVQPMARLLNVNGVINPLLKEDFEAVEGRAFFVTMTQLVYDTNGAMKLGTAGKIVDPSATGGADFTGNSAGYPEAVIAFQASFYILPTVSAEYLETEFDLTKFNNAAFARNMAVRR